MNDALCALRHAVRYHEHRAYGYTGEPTDGNGLVYLCNRYYRPAIGQFISVDPLETANRYAYVGGNVVNMLDPSGLVAASPMK